MSNKPASIAFMALALVAAALGIWVLVGVMAFIVRVAALIFLVMAVLALRRKAVGKE
ncbi:MAG: hypothetical protein JWL81_1358 [Verrucomicrobiales bacterium]|nr:hypothetical protein [Verrucomicrobiales bacterium]